MLIGRTVNVQAVATFPLAQSESSLPTFSPLIGGFAPSGLRPLSPLARSVLLGNWTPAAPQTPLSPAAAPALEPNTSTPPMWQLLRQPVAVGTAFVPPPDARVFFADGSLAGILKPGDLGLKPVTPAAHIPPASRIGDIQFKRVLQAGAGFELTKFASKTLYFSSTAPPDQFSTLLQNYTGLLPDAAQHCASSLLALLRAPAGHAILYGLAMTGAGLVVLQVTHEKPTLSRTLRWLGPSFALGVAVFLGLFYLGWAR